ncbi:MAG: hypothetical protein ACYDHD_00100 [Vulcanimicrobiaceae bacterium]
MLFDLYLNGADNARYMLPDLEGTDFTDILHRFLTGTLKREPQHRFVEERGDTDTPDELALNIYCQDTDTWLAVDDADLHGCEVCSSLAASTASLWANDTLYHFCSPVCTATYQPDLQAQAGRR